MKFVQSLIAAAFIGNATSFELDLWESPEDRIEARKN